MIKARRHRRDRNKANWHLVHSSQHVQNTTLTHFAKDSKMGTMTRAFDARLANRPFLSLDFRALALWRAGLSARQSSA